MRASSHLSTVRGLRLPGCHGGQSLSLKSSLFYWMQEWGPAVILVLFRVLWLPGYHGGQSLSLKSSLFYWKQEWGQQEWGPAVIFVQSGVPYCPDVMEGSRYHWNLLYSTEYKNKGGQSSLSNLAFPTARMSWRAVAFAETTSILLRAKIWYEKVIQSSNIKLNKSDCF